MAIDVQMENESHSDSDAPTDVRTFLISNYKDALKNGDRSAAKSCLLAAKHFISNDILVTNEIYLMAKLDGDSVEASKCFARIFCEIFTAKKECKNSENELTLIREQMEVELKMIMDDLKSYYMKFKSRPPTNSIMDACPNLTHEPTVMLFNKNQNDNKSQVSNGDRFSYKRLFDNLPYEISTMILDHSIDSCADSLDKCLLMMLSISISSKNASKYGNSLLRELIHLTGYQAFSKDDPEGPKLNQSVQQYCKSLLILDAIPLVFGIRTLNFMEFDIEDLLLCCQSYYCEIYVEKVSREYKLNELHDGLKKTIAARILGKENNPSPLDELEDNIISVIGLLLERFLSIFSDRPDVEAKLKMVKSLIDDKKGQTKKTSDKIIEVAKDFDLSGVPLKLFESPTKDITNEEETSITPPPRARGRPKKSQSSVIVAPDHSSIKNKVRQANFLFHTLVQHALINCAKYLRQTRSRVILKFDNALADLIESDLAKSLNQRSSRSKHLSNDSNSSPSKKLKVEISPAKSANSLWKHSPLNSEQSRLMDLAIVDTLMEAHKCIAFLSDQSEAREEFRVIWQKFESNLIGSEDLQPYWLRRITADRLLLTGRYDLAIETLSNTIDAEKRSSEKLNELEECTAKSAPSSPVKSIMDDTATSVRQLRALTQLISCNVQARKKAETYNCIRDLLNHIMDSGSCGSSEGYSSGNMIDEYMIIVHGGDGYQNLGFLFFDALSMIRYAIDILMEILRRHVVCLNATSDTVIGHIIALSQFDWPKESPIYKQCTEWLRTSKPKSTTPQCLSASTKFSYNEFFMYIFNPNIIEDFMAMLNQGYTLDIKNPLSTSQTSSQQRASKASGTGSTRSSGGSSTRSSKAITTRGVNKTFKEDLKVALIARMKQSSSLMSLELVTEFVQNTLIPFLTS